MMTLPSNLEKLATHKKILLLQGPIGDFFLKLSQWLQAHDARVYKINLNGGDSLFYPDSLPDTYPYQAAFSEFGEYFDNFVKENNIDAVVCFGDTRMYHRIASKICAIRKISFWAFEEGYFRPHWVTLEETGVNAYSALPRNGEWFLNELPKLKQQIYQDPIPVAGGFKPVAIHAIRYYAAMFFEQHRFPDYQHHRSANPFYYIKSWARSGRRRVWYAFKEAKIGKKIRRGEMGKFFILPLQVSTDSQIRVHSHYHSVRDCLMHVMSSFAINAPEDCKLIVKHHPMDRGFIDYHRDIRAFIKTHPKMRGRIIYVHDVPLPDLLRQGVGMVTMNSTSGLSALIHNLPVKIIGNASYDIAGVTSQKHLNKFWSQPEKPNADMFHAYRMYHINQTQINGNFYTEVRLPKLP
ncbi:capsule biosynthesis protein [Kingella negevensis]|uniref:Capsule polysaccharide biosynthesis protein n=1 Tax=Kingella negevensis TaxID=1522312 RepID=A0A238TEE2_9NEIS|nr:capsule biosynthesis protein [Kingella negevensis]MDK4698289.1 capsule biosynthesis protein [Kingella negevensis]SNB83443.1 Capsule polysaccharide biosynthesis protein [Kingella negevensis]